MMDELQHLLGTKKTALWTKVTEDLVRWFQNLHDAHMKRLLGKYDPSRGLRVIPCENDCGKVIKIGDDILMINSHAKKSRNHGFCSVHCHNENKRKLQARHHKRRDDENTAR